jgi:hypothetical protein
MRLEIALYGYDNFFKQDWFLIILPAVKLKNINWFLVVK